MDLPADPRTFRPSRPAPAAALEPEPERPMADPARDTDDEKPLDPAVEAVRKRLARLLGVSIGIMMIGLLAVLGAIVYRLQATSTADAASGTLAVPAGAEVLGHAQREGEMSLRVRLADGTEAILVYSLADGRRIGEWRILAQP